MVFGRKLKLGLITSLCCLLLIPVASADKMLPTATVARIFSQVSKSPSLSDPAMILIDKKTSEVVFEKSAESLRRPASILKILSSAVALEYLGDEYRFETRAYIGSQPRAVTVVGNFDPWMASNSAESAKDKRASITSLGAKLIAAVDARSGFKVRNIMVRHAGIYSVDLRTLYRFFRSKGIAVKFSSLPSTIPSSYMVDEVGVVKSPTVGEMTKFALTWSDNLLAERLARAGAHAAGLSMSDVGVGQAMINLLSKLQIDFSSLSIKDGSGLSKSDHVSVLMMAQLLEKIREDNKFAPIYEGLPISGLTGTLKDRYLATAPQGIGLIRAKTGTLDGTVSLAGYVDAGDREYIFVVIADKIKKGSSATTQARNTIDRLMAKIASPLYVAR